MKHPSVTKLAVILLLLLTSHASICDKVEELYQQIKKIQSADSILTYESLYSDQATDSELAKYYFLVAWKYRKVENYADAFAYYNKSLEIYRDLYDLHNMERCMESLGSIAIRLLKHEKAYAYYYQAWEINKTLGNQREIALSLQHMGLALSKTLDSKKEGLWYLTQAADLLEELEEPRLLSIVYLEKGNIYDELGEYGSAMDCYQSALKYSPNSDKILAKVLNNQSYLLQAQGNYEAALTLQDSALVIKRRLGDAQLLMTSLNTLGVIQYQLGHYDQAFETLMEAFATNIGQKTSLQNSYPNLLESYLYLDSVSMARGDASELLESGVHKIFIAKQNKLLAQQEAYRIRNIIYQGDQIIEKENLMASLHSSRQMLWILGIVLLVSLTVMTMILVQKIKITRERDIYMDNFERTRDRMINNLHKKCLL